MFILFMIFSISPQFCFPFCAFYAKLHWKDLLKLRVCCISAVCAPDTWLLLAICLVGGFLLKKMSHLFQIESKELLVDLFKLLKINVTVFQCVLDDGNRLPYTEILSDMEIMIGFSVVILCSVLHILGDDVTNDFRIPPFLCLLLFE